MARSITIIINHLPGQGFTDCGLVVKETGQADQTVTAANYKEALGTIVQAHNFQVDQNPLTILSVPTKSDNFPE